MTRHRSGFWAGLACALGFALLPHAALAAAKPFQVYMVLYRGITEAEKGFMDYFKSNHIPVQFTVRDCAEDKTRLPGFVGEIKRLRPDLVYTFGTTVTAAIAGKSGEKGRGGRIADIPVVFDIVADPVGAGLVSSLVGSGRNLTGGSHLVPLENQLQALASVTSIGSLAMVYNPSEQNSLLTVQALKALAGKYRYRFTLYPILVGAGGSPDGQALAGVMARVAADKPHVLYLPSDSFIISQAAAVTQLAHQAGILTFSATEAPVRHSGALMGLVSSYYNVGQFAAYKAEQILVNKIPPGRIPIETLNRFSFLLNMKEARALHFYPPISVFKFAEVIDDEPLLSQAQTPQ
ncbi:MAG: ABC transporter substrate-binding protein [Sulfuricellaceae bacterium]|nr:ABC transporter substrate-binding protein [Sulfuricellaceae bacterium]